MTDTGLLDDFIRDIMDSGLDRDIVMKRYEDILEKLGLK